MIYHVALHTDWHDAIVSGEYRVSTLGRSLDEVLVGEDGVEIRREDAGNGELFPHIYGAIRPGWVVSLEDL